MCVFFGALGVLLDVDYDYLQCEGCGCSEIPRRFVSRDPESGSSLLFDPKSPIANVSQLHPVAPEVWQVWQVWQVFAFAFDPDSSVRRSL